MKFVEMYVKGLVKPSDLDTFIDRWHDNNNNDDDGVLHEFLGFTWEQYCRWVFNASELESILMSFKQWN